LVPIDIERRLAIVELLAQPDPPDLRRRGHHLLLDGKPNRYEMIPVLSSLFVQQRLLALEERRAAADNSTACPAVQWETPQALQRQEALIAA